MPVEVRVRLDRQVVERQVRDTGIDRCVDVGARFIQGLAGQRVHQIEIDVVEVFARDIDRTPGFAAVVDAAERLEMPWIEALDADGETCHARVAVAAEFFRLEGSGIRLQGDLAVRGEGETRTERRYQGVDRRGGEKTGRAAAEEDAPDSPPPHFGQRLLEVAHQ